MDPTFVHQLQRIVVASKAVLAELQGQAAHERLQLARQELHQSLEQGKEGMAALEEEIAAIEAAVVSAEKQVG